MVEHKGSRETYDFIADWYDCPIPFSKHDGWGRFGILAVIGDLILYGLKEGAILEIGVGESSIYLTQLAQKHHRKIYHCDYALGKIENPMTIPGYLSDNRILIKENQVVDYSKFQAVLFAGTSDNFFTQIQLPKIALAFIDGDHNYEFVKRDFWNLVPLMKDDGVIFLHDTYPPEDSYVSENKCGTVYKLRQEIEKDKAFDCFTFTKVAAVGVGITMVRVKPKTVPYYQE